MSKDLRANDTASWTDTIWTALQGYRENCIPEGQDEAYDDEWSDIATAMAWIEEVLENEGAPQGDNALARLVLKGKIAAINTLEIESIPGVEEALQDVLQQLTD